MDGPSTLDLALVQLPKKQLRINAPKTKKRLNFRRLPLANLEA